MPEWYEKYILDTQDKIICIEWSMTDESLGVVQINGEDVNFICSR
jgi:hypothetical protein